MGNGKKRDTMKKTKIICTIGPASREEDILKGLIAGGMDIARINTSHSDAKEVIELVKKIRKVSGKLNKNTAIMLDLQGPKIRVGKLENKINLVKNKKLFLLRLINMIWAIPK